VTEWLSGWMDGWMDGWMNELINEWVKERMNEQTKWTNKQTKERMNNHRYGFPFQLQTLISGVRPKKNPEKQTTQWTPFRSIKHLVWFEQ